ncbi:hypothetical protein BJ684DRAFT_1143, partial [Piptocephalis cylindrospora]
DEEEEMIMLFTQTVLRLDPDILIGWEVNKSSWGFLVQRGEFHLSTSHFAHGASRQPESVEERWRERKSTFVRIPGRYMFNMWRLMRSEVALNLYTMENVVFHVLKKRIPRYSSIDLTDAFNPDIPSWISVAHACKYMRRRCRLSLELARECGVFARASEFATIYGIDLFSVLVRGSQYRVESLLLRVSKLQSFLLPSPSTSQVASQKAVESIPLILEPQASYYEDPVIVLDFQSLYPSIMVAYNLCYSTCLGRINAEGDQMLGTFSYSIPPEKLQGLLDQDQVIAVASNGVMYVKPKVRESLLAQMLRELLETRIMLKQAMSHCKDDDRRWRQLDMRQLAIKLLCNVMYGYVGASFSGRMPCGDIADSIVQNARETLQNAIRMIQSRKDWGARVIYGDTDSVFVLTKGVDRKRAFEIGEEIALAVTQSNPSPIKLQMEKIYHPCILLAKKRYVGYKYRGPNDSHPILDAKGIETVRRDGCGMVQRVLGETIEELFVSKNLTMVRKKLEEEWGDLMAGKINLTECLISTEVKAEKYKKGPSTLMPEYGERVPFLVAFGRGQDARLIDQVVSPEEFVGRRLKLNYRYYVEKQLIPVLDRVLKLLGVDVRTWW